MSKDTLEFPETSARVWTLDNGLEVIVKEDHSAPVVSMQAWCRAGSIHEGGWLGAGMSHFLEHMLFKGTERRNANEIAQTVQREGGYINAYTSFDRTVYWIDAPATGAETCLDVLCDVVGFAQLPEEEFDNESDVIRREIAMGEDSPEQVLSKSLFRTAYSVHPCRYPVIGFLDLFNQLSRDDLYGYYREKYSPDNLFIVVAGDVKGEEIVASIESQLGGLERRRRSPVILPEEPRQMGIREESVSFSTDLFRGRVGWPVPSGDHPDVPALDLLGAILGGGKSSRLYREVRDSQQLVHSVGAYAYTPSFSGQFILSFDTETEKAEAAEAAVFAEVQKLKDGGVTAAELSKVGRQSLSSQFSTLTDMRGQASDLGSNWLSTRNLNYTREYVRSLQQVDADQIVEAARRYMDPECYTRVSLVPETEKVERAEPVRKGRSEDIRKLELENGLTVLLLADHRVPFVQSSAAFRGGLMAETPTNNGLTRLMSRLLVKDTEKRSADETATLIESVGGGIGSSIGSNSFGVSVHSMSPDLELTVNLLADAVLRPSFLEESVDREKQFQIAQILAEMDRPFSVAMKRLREEIFGGHPYGLGISGTEESVKGLDRSLVTGLHQRLVNGGNGVVGLFGDMDLSKAEDLILAQFSSDLPKGEREFCEDSNFAYPSGNGQVIELEHDKEQAVLLIGFRTVNLTHPDNPALELIDEACSDMASRLFIRIREELGLAYSVGASRMQGLDPGMILFYASTAPEKLDQVQQEMLNEIELIVNEGLQGEEFDRAKASWLGREIIHLQGVRELAGTATIDELVGLGWDNYRKSPDEIRAVTRDQVRDVASRYFTEQNRTIVRLTRSQ